MEKRHYLAIAACLLVAALVAPAPAYQQPSVNLGFTSFVDGGPPAGPGFYFGEYVQYYTANKLANMAVADPDISAWVSLSQFIYQSDTPILWGGKWGINAIVPVVGIDSGPNPPLANTDGLGDIAVGPYLQWDPIMGANGPKFMHRVELQTIWPTGNYENTSALNAGSNFFSFDPYWAATYFFTPRWTASCRVHYLWNGTNDDPAGAGHSQAGQAIHANFASSYDLVPRKLRVGVNGYFLEQLSNSEVDGADVADDESVWAIGPGALLSFSQNSHLFFNAYFETDTDYRPEGERFILRFVHHF